MAIRVFLDANVILNFVLKREKFESVKSLFELGERNQIKLFISASILQTIAYWLRKNSVLANTKTTMLLLLEHIKVVEGNHDCSVKVLESNCSDIEYALQYCIALHNKMNFIISFDKGFQKYSSQNLKIIEVEDFLKNK